MQRFAHLKQLVNKPVLYVGEVGAVKLCERSPRLHFKDVRLFKYGISDNVYNRIAYSHLKRFDYFDLKMVKETSLHRLVEKQLTQELKRRGLHIRMDINGHTHRELFYLDDDVDESVWLTSTLEELIQKAHSMCDV